MEVKDGSESITDLGIKLIATAWTKLIVAFSERKQCISASLTQKHTSANCAKGLSKLSVKATTGTPLAAAFCASSVVSDP